MINIHSVNELLSPQGYHLVVLRINTSLTRLELFNLPTLMHNSLFINNMYVTPLSSTCFEH